MMFVRGGSRPAFAFLRGDTTPRVRRYYSPKSILLSRSTPSPSLVFQVQLSSSPSVNNFIHSFLGGRPCRRSAQPEAKFLATSIADTEFQHHEDGGVLVRFFGKALGWMRSIILRLYEICDMSIRTAEIIIRFSPCLVMIPTSIIVDPWIRSFGSDDNDVLLADITWGYVTYQVQQLGPAFVKLCQWIATRRDIFPQSVCSRLSILHDAGIPHSWRHTHEILQSSFGSDYYEDGLRIDQHSSILGCGSAAQVYRGAVRIPGRNDVEIPVAVKVLHPRFKENIERDIHLMTSTANVLHTLIPSQKLKMLNLPRATDAFANILRMQADLRYEGLNLSQFRSNFYGEGGSHGGQRHASQVVLFPRPVTKWTHEHVLVEELVTEAQPIAVYMQDDSDRGHEIRKQLAPPLLRAFLKMVFVDNCMYPASVVWP
jgi:aarF domain-containing kinase